jgi:hypothetical protein
VDFTALHRELGRQRGPVTDDMLDQAIAQGVTETDDLDWKARLPPRGGIATTDFCKDVAAMANFGGGVIVYGIQEHQKAATGRCDVGDFHEAYQRDVRSAAVTGIHPPIFGLAITAVGEPGSRAVVVAVPPSIDGPHLIYRNEYFGAPIRNDADTVWMRERQIESMYRARFDERRASHEALDGLYADAAGGRSVTDRAWMVGVARPRIQGVGSRISREQARTLFRDAEGMARSFTHEHARHRLPLADLDNPRPGLRRWVAVPHARDVGRNRESWAAIHNDGSITLATAIDGGRLDATTDAAGWQISSLETEAFVADVMGLIRIASGSRGGEYETRIGIEWGGHNALEIFTVDNTGYPFFGASVPLPRYTPVEVTVRIDEDDETFRRQVIELATDVINQGGISNLQRVLPLP